MPFTLKMPKMSPTMEAGTIAKWHKKVGDYVEPGDVLLEVATDKATLEYEALDPGHLRKILVEEGGDAAVNQALAVFTEEKNESIDDYVPEGQKSEKEESVDEEKQADSKEESKQASKAPAAEGSMRQPAFAPEAPIEDYQFEAPREKIGKRLAASPLARRLADEKGLDLSSVKGSGPGKRIMARDLVRAQVDGTVAFSRREVPDLAPGTYEEEALTPMRKIVGQRLQEAKTFIPHFYVTQEIDATSMVEIRTQLKEYGVSLTFNDFVVRASALALREHPIVNSGFNTVNQTITRFKTVDIAIAVSLEGGLITPIVRHADYKNIGELSVEVKNLAKRARDGKLLENEYKGGSFTISNLGMYGISEFVAVINPPHGAILAVGGILDKPVIKAGAVVPGKTMMLTLSSDHRVIDGAAAADFLRTLKRYLENPSGLLVG